VTDRLYLNDNVRMEPTIGEWYAWPFLISPATAALTTANLHLRILESFASAPELHRAAARNPAMRGGPFMDYDGGAEEVRAFIARTRESAAPLFELAAALTAFDGDLRKEADGFSLQHWYERVPAALRGFVELGYDLHHTPSMRLIEGLLYRSRYYDPSRQSLLFSEGGADDRPFILSTPRLAAENEPVAQVAFADPLLDALADFRTKGGSRTAVDDLVDRVERPALRDRLRSFFHATPPADRPERNYDGEGVRVRYFGHATVLFETRDVTIMTDPVVSYPVTAGIGRYTHHDLPEHIDYVLITHAHQDHVSIETLLQMRTRIGTIVVPRDSGGQVQDPSLRLALEAAGFRNVIELAEMGSIAVPGGEILGLPFLGEHGDLHVLSKLGYFLRLAGRGFMCVADSNNLQPELYEHIARAVGKVDYLFLGMECDGAPMSWLYGPLFGRAVDRKIDQSRRLNGSDYAAAIEMVRCVSPGAVFVYAMGQEPWLTYLSSIQYTPQSRPIVESDRLVAECLRRGLGAERLYGQKLLLAA
jgi:L-ascorbate metabolism protein UlaG (beta-lactamase superfamily)